MSNFWTKLDPEWAQQYAIAQMKQLALQNAKASQDAQSRLYGGSDGSGNGIIWNPQGPDTGMAQVMGDQGAQPQKVPYTQEGLMGAGVPADQATNLMNGGPQDFDQQKQNWLKQANPQPFMDRDIFNSVTIPRLQQAGMSPQQINAMAIAPKEAGEAMGKAAFPEMTPEQKIADAVSKMDPNDPRRASLQAYLDKQGYIPEKDPLKRSEVQSTIDKNNAETGLAGARQQQIKSGNISDEDISDLATRYIQSGDKTLMTSLGRGTQGSVNLAKFQSEVNKQLQANGASQRDIEMANNTLKSAGSTLTAFDKGKQGDLTRSMNVAVSHLMTLDSLGQALDNGDMKLANQLKNTLSDAFGGVPIAGYEAAAPLVGDEVAKSVLGGGSAVADREKFAAPLSSARGTQARNAATNTFKGLLVGQLHGLERQYRVGTGLNDFGSRLDPEVAALLSNPQFAPGANPTQAGNPAVTPVQTISPAPAPSARKANTVYQTPKGPMTWTGTGWVPKVQ